MPPSILCPRHGHTASILACEHIRAAVSLGADLPAYRHMGVTVDRAGTVAYCACFACARQFERASERRALAHAEAEEFPKSDPICATCLEETRSSCLAKTRLSAAADLAAVRSESASSRPKSPVRPIQVTAAVLLLCVGIGTWAVPFALSWRHHFLYGAPSAIWVIIDAFLMYGIWMGQSRARDLYALIFALGMLPCLFISPGTINVPHVMLQLVALSLLYLTPSAMWFEAKLLIPSSD
jgi:hypothetical protein